MNDVSTQREQEIWDRLIRLEGMGSLEYLSHGPYRNDRIGRAGAVVKALAIASGESEILGIAGRGKQIEGSRNDLSLDVTLLTHDGFASLEAESLNDPWVPVEVHWQPWDVVKSVTFTTTRNWWRENDAQSESSVTLHLSSGNKVTIASASFAHNGLEGVEVILAFAQARINRG